MSQVDSSMTRMRLEADDRAKEQAQQLALIHAKLDTLLTGSNEQVFHHRIPVPTAEGLCRACAGMKPRHWFSKPMCSFPSTAPRAGNSSVRP